MAVEDGNLDAEAPCDLAIISNATNVPATLFQRLVARQVPLIFFHHDFSCRWRLFYPMRDKCRQCYLRDRWLPYYLRAKLHIWLSPLHREAWLFEYPELAESPFALVPSPVSAQDFTPLGKERRGVLVPSGLLEFKGRANILRWAEEHPDVPITAIRYGEEDPLHLPANITAIPTQPPSAMNELYNRHEAVLHLPSTPQPFERVCAEAIVAGCKVVANELVGALSYDWFRSREDVARECGVAPQRFWEAVETAVARDTWAPVVR